MEFEEMHEGISVITGPLIHLPKSILARGDLGEREEGAYGVIIVQSVPGFPTDAKKVELRDEWGRKIGKTGIYFREN